MRTKDKNSTTKKFSLGRTLVIVAAALSLVFYPTMSAYADTYDEQIRALEQEVSRFQEESGKLRAEADTLQNAISSLTAQQNAVQAQISQKEVELQQLQEQIVLTEERIASQKDALAQNLKSMYLESDITPLEMVASSKSIGDYIDKQEYRNKIRESIQGALTEIRDLKAKLEEQKVAVENTLNDQKAMRGQLQAQQAEKDKLLAETKGQESAYQNLIGQRNSEIDSLRAQQRAANLSWAGNVNIGPACAGGYPGAWCNAPMDSIVDSWGMYNRECVSYTAFRVAASGRHMPYWGGVGNANQWDDNARAAGIPVDGNPKVGDVAILHAGYYGHAMYVEAVNGNGTILISEYNLDWTGRYSERVISTSGLVFIHF